MMNLFTLRSLGFGLAVIGALGLAAQSRMDTRSKAQQHGRAAAAKSRAPQSQLKHNNSGGLVSRGGGYCAASASGSIDFDLDERIVNVTFSNINNSSANTAPVAPAYTFYPNTVGNVTAGTSYTLSVNVNTTTLTTGFSENQVLAWIDYNQDFDFDDAGEEVLVSAIDALDIYSGSVTIPVGATVGTTRMRIRLHDTHDGTDYINVFNDTPCGDASYGEIEDYVLNISSGGGNAPANDNCVGAIQIGVNATCIATQGTTQNATQSQAPATCSQFQATAANDVWYSFVATAASTTISVTGAGDATTGMDPILQAFNGPCSNPTPLSCVDATLRGGTESLTIATTPGTTYFYRVYYWTYATAQTVFGFTTCVTAGGGGGTPVNDLCGSVTPSALSVGGSVTFTGDNTNATSDGDVVPGSDFDPLDPTVWHAFTTTECANVVVSYCNTAPAFENVWIFLAQACPVGNDYVIGAWETTTCGPNVVVSYYDLPAGTWYLPVLLDEAAPAVGPYSVTVSATACGSTGNYCEAGAAILLFEKISNVTFAGINNNSTSAAGFEDLTSVVGSVVAGQTYPISVTASGGYPTDQVLAWVDWDHSEVFDAGEIIFSSAIGAGPFTGNVTVPLTALAGETRMRVRLHDTYVGPDYPNTPNPTPCDTSRFGQVEDYTIDMIGIITGTGNASADAFTVYPNPNDGTMAIRGAMLQGAVRIEVIDALGRAVHTEQRSVAVGGTVTLDLAGRLASGSYVLRLSGGDKRQEQRITVR